MTLIRAKEANFNQNFSKHQIKNSQQIYLIVLGKRGVGKSTSLHAMYAQSQINQQWKLVASDRVTQNTIVTQVERIATLGVKPSATIKSDKFNFWVQWKTWWGWDKVAHLSLRDFPGEECKFQNSLFIREWLMASGCLIYLSGEEIFQVNERSQLEEILQPVKKVAQIFKDRKFNKKIAIVITKTDKFFDFFDRQEYYNENNILNRTKKRIKEILANSTSGYQIDYQIFESATTIGKDGERFVLRNSNCLRILAWLGQFQSLKSSQFPRKLSKKVVLILVICSFSLLGGVFGVKLLSSQLMQLNQPTWQN